MPRSGWLALGVAAAALVAGAAGDLPARFIAAVILVAAAALAVATTFLPDRMSRVAIPVAIGIAALGLRVGLGLGLDEATLAGAPDGRGPWTVIVESVGSPREGRQVATVRTLATGTAGFRLATSLPRYPAVEPGDTLVLEGRTRPRPDSPYGRYLERLGAWGSLDADTMSVQSTPAGPARMLERWRRGAGDALTVTLPEPEAGLAAGILIGLRDRVDRGVAAAFTTAGVSHVVAISGWNIAIVTAAVAAIAGGLGRRRRSLVTVLAIGAYIAFAGASPSVLRAGAMAGVVLLARESGRAGYAAAALGWAAAILLLADPALIGDAGFQLSTVATVGLIAWASPLADRIDRLTGGRAPRWLRESLGVSLAAQAATLPIVLASFGRLAVVAPVVNLAIVPLVAPAMAAGAAALLGGLAVGAGAPAAVGAIVAAPAWVSLRLIIAVVEASAGLPFASVAFGPEVGVVLGLASAGSLAAAALVRRRRRRGRAPRPDPSPPSTTQQRPSGRRSIRTRPTSGPPLVGRLVALALVSAVGVTGGVVAARPPGIARVTVLDVGQGDAILIEGSQGGRILVDGGPDPDRLLVVLGRRIPAWDRRIDAVILSHPHEDHVAGLAMLLARYRVARVFEPGMPGPGPGYAAWLEQLGRPGAPARLGLAAGDRLTVDDLQLRALWPRRGEVPAEAPDTGTGINNVSIVLLGEVGDRRFLLTGDVEEDVDPSLVAAGVPAVDLLKVAHHGSRTATTDAFLAAARPRVAIASAGADNPYGHPARSTLERLGATGARVYRTDVDGTVTVAFERGAMTVAVQPRVAADLVARPSGVIAREAGAAGTSSGPAPRAPSFVCAVPALVDVAARPDRRPDDHADVAAAGPTRTGSSHGGYRPALRYHRSDDGALARGGRCPAALPGSPALGPRARARRGGGRGVAGLPDRASRDRDRPARRRGGGPAPRRRQDAARDGPGRGPPPRRGLRRLADPAGSS